MTDLDKIKACARAMGIECGIPSILEKGGWFYLANGVMYNPLANAAQADALEGWLLERGWFRQLKEEFFFANNDGREFFFHADMTIPENRRRARVECVAKMVEVV